MKQNSILAIFVCFLCTTFSSLAKAQTTNPTDSLALVDLYNSTQGNAWTTNTNWLTTSPLSTWYGVTVTNNRITGLHLEVNNLSGSVPSSIGNIDSLQYLYLYYNNLSGSIPNTIGKLSALKELLLGDNKFSGSIPFNLGKLVQLEQLQLARNQFSNAIPSSIGNLKNLVYADLSNNQLSGSIPTSISQLTNVEILQLSANKLSGSIPNAIGKLSSVQYLYLQDNQFTGVVPSAIGRLTNLLYLYLDNNKLSGTIPTSFSRLKNLQFLSLPNNALNGSIPAALGKLPSLTYLLLNNNQLSGALPASLANLTKLQYLDVSHNHLVASANDALPLPTSVLLHTTLTYNNYTFNGLEYSAPNYPYITYSPQSRVKLHLMGDSLCVTAGGTLKNNVYTWHLIGSTESFEVKGDSTFIPATAGKYFAEIRNSIATQLVLYTDTLTFGGAPANKSGASIASLAEKEKFLVYPNPAKDIVHIRIEGTAVITLANASGNIMLTKTVTGSADIDVSSFAGGLYYLQNKTTGKTQKLIVAR